MTTRTSSVLALVLLVGAGQAQAVPLTAAEMLQQFNVVVSGNVDSNSHVDGRVYVGGNVKGGNYVQHKDDTPASVYAGLTVRGNVSNNVQVNGFGAVVGGKVSGISVNSGESYVGATASGSFFSGNVWINGAASGVNFGDRIHAASYSGTNPNDKILHTTTSTMDSTLAASTSTNFGSLMTSLSAQLAALTPTPGAGVEFGNNGARAIFTGTPVDDMLVFDLTELDSMIFSSAKTINEFDFVLNGAKTVIFNTDDRDLHLAANFLGQQLLGSSMIWNFAGASSVTVDRTFVGQVLVADGIFQNINANVEGGVYARDLVQRGEIHLRPFTGSLPPPPVEVPEPGTLALLAAGAGLIGVARRRQRA